MERDEFLGYCPYRDDSCIYDLTDDVDCSECDYKIDSNNSPIMRRKKVRLNDDKLLKLQAWCLKQSGQIL